MLYGIPWLTLEEVEEDMVQGVDHVAIAVWSTESSLPYYVEQLGFAVINTERLSETGVHLTYLDAGNMVLQLVEPLRDGPVRRFLEERGEGLHHLCFSVQDISGALETLDGEHGSEIISGGLGRRTCNLPHHPNGLNIELTESEPSLERATPGSSPEESIN